MSYFERFMLLRGSIKDSLMLDDEIEIGDVEEYNDIVAVISYGDADWYDEYPEKEKVHNEAMD